MADVANAPETKVLTKTVESKVDDVAVKKEKTKTVEGITEKSTEVKPSNVKAVEVTDVKEEGQEENTNVSSEKPEAAAEKNTEATSQEAVKNTDVVVETKKEGAPPKVILHQFPPGKHIPNASPFCLKLETFLRIHKIPYENQYGYKMGKKGKLPWIEYKGEVKADSNFIINYLNDKFEVDLDKDFTSHERALGRVTRVMLEENTYWALVYNRYIEHFDEFKKCIAPSGSGIGFSISQKLYQGKMRTNLDGHGLGRHTKEELYSIAERDLKAVSDLLGNKPYLLGDVSSFDCAVFGLCANLLYSGVESPMSTYIKENATNLSAFCERMKETYWEDWGDMVVGEKTEPTLKKGFSFRKKASKSPKQKAPEKEGEVKVAAEIASAADAAPPAEENNTAEEKTVKDGETPLSKAATEMPDEKEIEPAEGNKTESVTESNVETPAKTELDKKE